VRRPPGRLRGRSFSIILRRSSVMAKLPSVEMRPTDALSDRARFARGTTARIESDDCKRGVMVQSCREAA
jgi:hypothetical protein